MIAAIPLVTSALSSLAPSTATSAAKASTVGGDFGSILSQVSNDAVQKLKTAEASAVSGIEGKASAQDVVQSVMSAQESLQTALAVRDKSVSAFQEITRMAI